MLVRTIIRARYSPKSTDLPDFSSLEVGAEVETDINVKGDETIAMRLQGARDMCKHISEAAVPTAMEVLDYVRRRVEAGGTGADGTGPAPDSAGPGAGVASGTQAPERHLPDGDDELPPELELE